MPDPASLPANLTFSFLQLPFDAFADLILLFGGVVSIPLV